jgi:DNA-binding response OmpR family regulator
MSARILIVEDEPNILIPLKFLMEQNGYEVFDVQKGEDVIPAIENKRPDLILLDIMLPKTDGFAVCQMIRNNPGWNNIKIIIISAMGNELDIKKGLALGADEYITKPFSNADVINRVKKLLSK